MFLPQKNFENYDLKAPNPLYGLIFFLSFSCHLHAICMRSYFIYMYWYVIRIYSYVIRMSLVCIRMSLVCTRMSSVCHSYWYVIGM